MGGTGKRRTGAYVSGSRVPRHWETLLYQIGRRKLDFPKAHYSWRKNFPSNGLSRRGSVRADLCPAGTCGKAHPLSRPSRMVLDKTASRGGAVQGRRKHSVKTSLFAVKSGRSRTNGTHSRATGGAGGVIWGVCQGIGALGTSLPFCQSLYQISVLPKGKFMSGCPVI